MHFSFAVNEAMFHLGVAPLSGEELFLAHLLSGRTLRFCPAIVSYASSCLLCSTTTMKQRSSCPHAFASYKISFQHCEVNWAWIPLENDLVRLSLTLLIASSSSRGDLLDG